MAKFSLKTETGRKFLWRHKKHSIFFLQAGGTERCGFGRVPAERLWTAPGRNRLSRTGPDKAGQEAGHGGDQWANTKADEK